MQMNFCIILQAYILSLEQELSSFSPEELTKVVVIEEHPNFPGELIFQPFQDENTFYGRYSQWISPYLVLNELFNLDNFSEILQADGYHLIFDSSCDAIINNYQRWRQPLQPVPNITLFPFQQFSLRRAIEQTYWFFNWSTGTGKGFVGACGAKWLLDLQEVDVVIVCTVSAFKQDMCDFFRQVGIDAVVNDGTPPSRQKVYQESHQAFICNYEKLWVDFEHWQKLLKDKSVLIIADECQKIISSGTSKNKSRKAIERLWELSGTSSHVWLMSATVVDGNPLRYRDAFSVCNAHNPLGTKKDFVERYANTNSFQVAVGKGYKRHRIEVVEYDWKLQQLTEVRHRVGGYTHAVRKTDPGIVEQFKDMPTIIKNIHPYDPERELTEMVIAEARLAQEREESLVGYYQLLRTIANTPLALSLSEVGQPLLEKFNVSRMKCSKLDTLNEHLSSIRDQGDKVLVFTHWTNLTLNLIDPLIDVPHVIHYGTGQSEKDSQAARQRFRTDNDITCFLTSDAGREGLSMQCARYVIQYEPTYSHDHSIQRASRIHRVDSYLDGLTNYIYCTTDSIEERVLRINHLRRVITEGVQGTVEALSMSDRQLASHNEGQNQGYLIFGK